MSLREDRIAPRACASLRLSAGDGWHIESWVVPKDRHFVPARSFAGDIPAGRYGAGHIDTFEHGVWSAAGEPHDSIATGRIGAEYPLERATRRAANLRKDPWDGWTKAVKQKRVELG